MILWKRKCWSISNILRYIPGSSWYVNLPFDISHPVCKCGTNGLYHSQGKWDRITFFSICLIVNHVVLVSCQSADLDLFFYTSCLASQFNSYKNLKNVAQWHWFFLSFFLSQFFFVQIAKIIHLFKRNQYNNLQSS